LAPRGRDGDTEPVASFRLDGRVALVTGAGQGVGAGIARALAEHGARVAVNDLSAERAERVVADLTTTVGATALAVPFDVTDLAAAVGGAATVAAHLGPVDVLVNNAGIPPNWHVAPFREVDPADWRAVVDVNLYGVLNCTKATIDGMCDRGWGRIVTVSSGAAQMGLPAGVSVYGAGKGAAVSFMRHLAVEVAPFGVTANSLALGLMAARSGEETPPGAVRRVPVGRLGMAEDVATAVVWLAAEGSWVTGQTIGINGGSPTS
jgi:NAD(P)-dependent dehydrogenase (short-subunit alcohol dehydrogenase family)